MTEHWARVKVGEQFQFINAAGEVMLTPDVVHVGSFHQGRAVVRPDEADEWAVGQKHLAFTVNGTLMSVSILRPVEAPSDSRTTVTVQTLLGDLTVEAR